MPKPKLVEVVWDDAHADLMEASYSELDDFHKPAVMHTIGWLLRDNEAGLTVANEECPADATYRGRTFIPRALVRDLRIIRKTKGKTHQSSSRPHGGSAGDSDLLDHPQRIESVAGSGD